MKLPKPIIEPRRLFEVAEATPEAIREWESFKPGQRSPYPPELLGEVDCPACLRISDFSRAEVEEATAFLVRMGYIVVGSPNKKEK